MQLIALQRKTMLTKFPIVFLRIIFVVIPIFNTLILVGQTNYKAINIASLSLANIVLDNNRRTDVNDIMEYYGWREGNDSLKWINGNGEEIIVMTMKDSDVINCVELHTCEDKNLSNILSTLQYTPTTDNLKEEIPGHNKIPDKVYENKRKRIALFQDGNKTLIVFFRSTKQGYTRYGPESKPSEIGD